MIKNKIMKTLRDFLKETNTTIDELLDTFVVEDVRISNYTKEKEMFNPEKMCGVMFAEYYIYESTQHITIQRTKRNKPEFYKSE